MRPLIAAVAMFAATPALAALPVGAVAPDFSTQGTQGGEPFQFSLKAALKKGPVVMYFFPKAFTSGCTIETKAFADASGEFKAAGATLIGVAADSIDDLKRFSTEACGKKFAMAVASPQMIADYKVALPLLAGRSNRTTFVIGKDGRIAWTLADFKPDPHITGSLAALKTLKTLKK